VWGVGTKGRKKVGSDKKVLRKKKILDVEGNNQRDWSGPRLTWRRRTEKSTKKKVWRGKTEMGSSGGRC